MPNLSWDAIVSKPNARKWLTRSRAPRANEILTGIWSFDGTNLRTMENIVRDLNKALPVDVTDEGFCGPSGVGSDFNRGLSVSGYGMDPLPIPIMDNGSLLAERGIASGFTKPEHGRIFHTLLDEMFGFHRPSSLRIRKEASTSLPYFENKVDEYKKPKVLFALKNLQHMLGLLEGGKYIEALQQYDVLLAYAMHERQQADSAKWDGRGYPVFKERLVPDEAYARTGGSEGSLRAADKRVIIEGHEFKMHSGMRRRPVWGMSFVPNYVGTAVVGCIREVYLERFAFTWKHRSFDEMSQKASRFKFAVGSDVKNMDNNVPRFGITEFCIGLRRHLNDDFVNMTEKMMRAPFVMPKPWRSTPEGYSPFFGKVPITHDAFDLAAGLPSGVFINPDFGKFWMMFVYLCMLHDCGVDVLSNMALVLEGLHPVAAVLNMSDDAVLLANDERLRDALVAYKSPYALLEPEFPAQFLGGVFMRGNDGVLKVVPNIITYFVNFYVPERGINSLSRVKTWPLGYSERRKHYSSAPAFREVDSIIESNYRKGYSISPWTLAQLTGGLKPLSDLSLTDEMVLANPHYLNFRVSAQEVSAETLNTIVATIPHEEFYESIKYVFK